MAGNLYNVKQMFNFGKRILGSVGDGEFAGLPPPYLPRLKRS
jgi:hypothetical protein